MSKPSPSRGTSRLGDQQQQGGRVETGSELTVKTWPWRGHVVVSISRVQGVSVNTGCRVVSIWLSQRHRGILRVLGRWSECTKPAAHPHACSTLPLQGSFLTLGAFPLSAAEALASRTPYRQRDLQGQDWAGETPASSRSPPATSPLPGWGCWDPVGCWAPPSAALPPVLPSSSKADRLVSVRGISGLSIPSPQASFVFPPLTCLDPPFFSPFSSE